MDIRETIKKAQQTAVLAAQAERDAETVRSNKQYELLEPLKQLVAEFDALRAQLADPSMPEWMSKAQRITPKHLAPVSFRIHDATVLLVISNQSGANWAEQLPVIEVHLDQHRPYRGLHVGTHTWISFEGPVEAFQHVLEQIAPFLHIPEMPTAHPGPAEATPLGAPAAHPAPVHLLRSRVIGCAQVAMDLRNYGDPSGCKLGRAFDDLTTALDALAQNDGLAEPLGTRGELAIMDTAYRSVASIYGDIPQTHSNGLAAALGALDAHRAPARLRKEHAIYCAQVAMDLCKRAGPDSHDLGFAFENLTTALDALAQNDGLS